MSRHGDRHSHTDCGMLPAARHCQDLLHPAPSTALMPCPPSRWRCKPAAQATEVAEKLHVPVSETPQWQALAAHVAEIDKTCAVLPRTCARARWGVRLPCQRGAEHARADARCSRLRHQADAMQPLQSLQYHVCDAQGHIA